MLTKTCNMCGKSFDLWDDQEDFSIHKRVIGYGSKHDGEALRLNLCCGCMDELIKSCKIYPCEQTK